MGRNPLLQASDGIAAWALKKSLEKGGELEIAKQETTPKQFHPVLALISAVTDLGSFRYREVVYHDGHEWCSYGNSETFQDGEQVIKWRYADEALPE